MGQIENRAVKQLQIRLCCKESLGILRLILTAKPIQEPIPFRGFKDTLQSNKSMGFTMLFSGEIPGDSKKIPFQGPLSWVKLADRPQNLSRQELPQIPPG